MLERFLEKYRNSAESYDHTILLEAIEFYDKDVKLRVRLHFDDTNVRQKDKIENWEILCRGSWDHSLMLGSYYDTFEYVNEETDHVLKWEHTRPWCSVTFHGEIAYPYAAIGRLYEAHVKLVEKWIPFDKYFNMFNQMNVLLSSGFGLLAEAPRPLARAYASALRESGIQVGVSEGQERNRAVEVLIFGNGYVVANRFEATKI